MLATCIATNVIFLQATHFVDIDSRDHFLQHSFGGTVKKLPFGVTVFHRESLGSQESYFFGELPGAFVENKYWYPSGSQKRKPMDTPGQIIATSHDLTPNGGLVREIPLIQGNLGWWNIIIWPGTLPRCFFFSEFGSPWKMVRSWKEDDPIRLPIDFFFGNFSGAKCC